MLTGFTAIFMASSLALIGNQYLEALGFEWLVLWLIATVVFIRGYVIAIRLRHGKLYWIERTTPCRWHDMLPGGSYQRNFHNSLKQLRA